MHKARLLLRPLRRGRSAELSRYESADPSTELPRFPGIFGLGEHADDRLGSRGADEDPAGAVELLVGPFDLGEQVIGDRLRANSHILYRLRVARQQSRGLSQRATVEGRTKEQRGGEAVAGHVILQIDDVARLLASEQSALGAQGLEHVAVADIGGDE